MIVMFKVPGLWWLSSIFPVAVGILPMIAPAIVAGISALFRHRGARAAERRQAKASAQEQRAEHARQIASPQALIGRLRAGSALGRLLGAVGGRAGAPPSLVGFYDKLRAEQPFIPGPAPIRSRGGWDLGADLFQAAQQVNPRAEPWGQSRWLGGPGRRRTPPARPVTTYT